MIKLPKDAISDTKQRHNTYRFELVKSLSRGYAESYRYPDDVKQTAWAIVAYAEELLQNLITLEEGVPLQGPRKEKAQWDPIPEGTPLKTNLDEDL